MGYLLTFSTSDFLLTFTNKLRALFFWGVLSDFTNIQSTVVYQKSTHHGILGFFRP